MEKKVIEIGQKEMETAIENVLTQTIQESFLNKFDSIEVSTKSVCEIWKINNNTLSLYIKRGIITPVNPGSSKLLFNLRDILVTNPKYNRHANNINQTLAVRKSK